MCGTLDDMPDHGRDRLRELLDAVLAGTEPGGLAEPRRLADMAEDAYSSPFHFNRTLARDAGEPPVRMRRRVLLERAAWQLAKGTSVTDAAFEAGYESVDGFSRAFTRAFGRSPSDPAADSHWLPAPNGIHFHPPSSLWVRSEEHSMGPLTEQLIAHDIDDITYLIETAKGLPTDDVHAVRAPGNVVLSWHGPEESIGAVLDALVHTKEVWLAAIDGLDMPARSDAPTIAEILERHDAVAPRWLAMVRDLERRQAWDDRLVDALCDPPESFVMSSVVAHVLTYSAHRRHVARRMLTTAGRQVDDGDPIMWLRARGGDTT